MTTTTTKLKTLKKKQPRQVAAPKVEACDYCGGDGWIEKMGFGYSGGYSQLKPCPKCSGG